MTYDLDHERVVQLLIAERDEARRSLAQVRTEVDLLIDAGRFLLRHVDGTEAAWAMDSLEETIATIRPPRPGLSYIGPSDEEEELDRMMADLEAYKASR